MAPSLARIVVFGSSAAVLVLEILAGRLAAPYIGVTLETFTGIIGVVLAAIAAGAWAGGRAADRANPARLLGPVLILSGTFALLAPSVVRLLGPSMRAGGPIEIVLLTASAFFLPAFMLSTVTPIVAKLRLHSLDETGRVVGSLSAVGTAGALVGTFVTGFLLLSAFPSRLLVLAVGVMLFVAGLAMSLSLGARRIVSTTLMIAITPALLLALDRGPCDYETSYFCAEIEHDPARPDGRILRLDSLRHSYVDLSDPAYLQFRYAKIVADVVAAASDQPHTAAYIGGGGFTLPRYFRAVSPGSSATVFEIDGKLVDLVRDELALQTSPDIETRIGDARLLLPHEPAQSFDVVVGDAFGGRSVPWHLTTREFLETVEQVLKHDGFYVMNLIDYPPLEFARAEVATMLSVFEHVAVIAPIPFLEGTSGGNYVIVGSQRVLPWDEIQRRTMVRGGSESVWADAAARAFARSAPILTDDFAPVDQMLGRP